MLVKRPNDIAFYNWADGKTYPWAKNLHERRKLAHLIDLDSHKVELKEAITFSAASRDFSYKKRGGFMQTSFAFYAENVLPDYDYITANYNCGLVSLHPSYIPDKFAFFVDKASVWGKYQDKYPIGDAPDFPKGESFYNSHFFINLPKELVPEIFKDVPIGGK